jgi:PhnB protein
MALTPHVFFNGNAEEVLELYRDALGGETEIVRFEGSPAAQGLPPEWGSKILYSALHSPLGDIGIMDAPPGRGGEAGGNFAIAIRAESEAQADAVFSKLVAGGTVIMPLGKTFWAEKFGMLSDKFGTKWMVQYG